MGLFLAALALAAVVGIYIHLREKDGILAAPKFIKYPRLAAVLFWTDDLAGALCGAPVIFSIFGGVCVFGFRLLFWLVSASWMTITLQSAWGRPTTPQEIATGLLGLDSIVWWFVAVAPLELWFVVIFPLVWFATLSLPTAIAKRILARRPVVGRLESKDRNSSA
jgi:hypothetical protein